MTRWTSCGGWKCRPACSLLTYDSDRTVLGRFSAAVQTTRVVPLTVERSFIICSLRTLRVDTEGA